MPVDMLVILGFYSVVLVFVVVYQQINHRKIVVQLIDRIMARNYGEIVQGQVLSSQDKGFRITLPEEDNDPNSVDALNKIL